MRITLIALLVVFTAVFANAQLRYTQDPNGLRRQLSLQQPLLQSFGTTQDINRTRRQLNIQGGGSGRQGFDLNVNARAPVWQSGNGRHAFDVTGQYSQHLGGPYGNSRPNFGAGGVYTFRF